MYELVPSDYMRSYLKEIGFEFTDFQKATLIWNTFEKTWREKLEMLEALADITNDSVLKSQIEERIEIENNIYTKFVDNQSKRHVYVVEDFLGYSIGFFLNCDKALNYAKKYTLKDKGKHCIHKYLLVDSDKDEVVTTIKWKINSRGVSEIDGDRTKEYNGEAVATMHLDLEGNIIDIYSDQIFKEEEKIIRFKERRFENQFIKIPFEAHAGVPVKYLRDGSYGILADDTDSWNDFMKKVEEKNLYVDFSDINVIVYQLLENGMWSHEHVNPLFLEIEKPSVDYKDEKSVAFVRAMESMSDYLSARYCEQRKDNKGESVVKYTREYVELCENNIRWKKVLREAKIATDIMC